MQISSDRNYVLLSVKWPRDNLVFWGKLSKDKEKRSYGGYTDDFRSCERYTLEELKKEGGFHDYFNEPLHVLKTMDSQGTWIVNVEDLENLGKSATHYTV